MKARTFPSIITAMGALRGDHGSETTQPAVLLSQFLALVERANRKARRAAKLVHDKAANRSPRARTAAKSKDLDLMAAIVREAHAQEARRLASLRARRR